MQTRWKRFWCWEFHKIYNLSPPSAVQRSPSVQQSNTALLLPSDTVTHNAAQPRTSLFTDIRSVASGLEFCSLGLSNPSRGRLYLSKRSSASSVGLVPPLSGLAWHAASCSVRRRLISARISLGMTNVQLTRATERLLRTFEDGV